MDTKMDQLELNQNNHNKNNSKKILEKEDDKISILLIDFKKAFDSINHQALFKKLLLFGFPPDIINAIKTLYKTAKISPTNL